MLPIIANVVRKGHVTQIALGHLEPVSVGELRVFDLDTGLDPVLQTLDVDVLHAALAPTRRDELVLGVLRLVGQTDAALPLLAVVGGIASLPVDDFRNLFPRPHLLVKRPALVKRQVSAYFLLGQRALLLVQVNLGRALNRP